MNVLDFIESCENRKVSADELKDLKKTQVRDVHVLVELCEALNTLPEYKVWTSDLTYDPIRFCEELADSILFMLLGGMISEIPDPVRIEGSRGAIVENAIARLIECRYEDCARLIVSLGFRESRRFWQIIRAKVKVIRFRLKSGYFRGDNYENI